MAGKVGARTFTEEDKAQAIATLAANGGNIKRTARDLDVAPATLRRWRTQYEQGQVSTDLVSTAATTFIGDAERIRDKALAQLEAAIDAGKIQPAQLITALGVLDDKITRAKGLPTSHVQTSGQLPPLDEMKTLMTGFVAGALKAAADREAEIVDAELVEEIPPLEIAG